MGSSLSLSRNNKKKNDEDLFCNTKEECAFCCAWVVLGDVVPCFAGICIRTSSPVNVKTSGNELWYKAIVAETCPICSCSPCQFNAFRKEKNDTKSLLL